MPCFFFFGSPSFPWRCSLMCFSLLHSSLRRYRSCESYDPTAVHMRFLMTAHSPACNTRRTALDGPSKYLVCHFSSHDSYYEQKEVYDLNHPCTFSCPRIIHLFSPSSLSPEIRDKRGREGMKMKIRLQFRSRRVTNCPPAEFTQCGGEATNGVERHRGWVKRIMSARCYARGKKDGTKELKRNVKDI